MLSCLLSLTTSKKKMVEVISIGGMPLEEYLIL